MTNLPPRTFSNLGDGEGVIGWLGRQRGKEDSFLNPAVDAVGRACEVVVRAPKVERGSLLAMTEERCPQDLTRLANCLLWLPDSPEMWVSITFDKLRVRPSVYSFASFDVASGLALKCWVLEASNDAENWTVIDSRNRVPFTEEAPWNCFLLRQTSSLGFYSSFRLRPGANGSTLKTNQLLAGVFEIYGELQGYAKADLGKHLYPHCSTRKTKYRNPTVVRPVASEEDWIDVDAEELPAYTSHAGNVPADDEELPKYTGRATRKPAGALNPTRMDLDDTIESHGMQLGPRSKRKAPQTFEDDKFAFLNARALGDFEILEVRELPRGSVLSRAERLERDQATGEKARKQPRDVERPSHLHLAPPKLKQIIAKGHQGLLCYLGRTYRARRSADAPEKRKDEKTWVNPLICKAVGVVSSHVVKGSPLAVCDQFFSDQVFWVDRPRAADGGYTEESSSVQVNLWCGVACSPTHYSFSHRAGPIEFFARSWSFDAALSPDGPWDNLSLHNNDNSINSTTKTGLWDLQSNVYGEPIELGYYKCFRITLAPRGNSRRTEALVVSCFEVYGDVRFD
ncbi:hypothetical protein DIPPA_08455 [Diplonema papillatum]|nr:hypothetical protein DIPPA_08455 [Diplonema papillatum]|eukprot:gene21616-33261_t